jgi:flagellar hook-associated protein 2
MTGIQLSGLSSGLDTTSVIQALMAAASAPQTLLNKQIAGEQTTVADLQKLNSAFASLATLTDKFTGTPLTALSASSSNSAAATVTADDTAAAGGISFTVDALASRQVMVTGPLASWPATPPALTIVSADGVSTDVTPSSNSLDSVVQAINASGAGVTAVKVAAGADASGNALYRLQLSSSQTGANAAFSVYAGTAADVAAGTAADLATAISGTTTISSAQDAQLTLWPGTAAAQSVTSATNTFADVLPGVDVTVQGVSADPVTVSVDEDLDTEAGNAATLVNSVQSLLAGIKQGQTAATSTDSSGNTTTVFGSFTGDSTVRQAGRDLTDALTMPVNGVSPSSIGIQLDKDGNVSLDQDAFEAAMTKDPAGTSAMFGAITARINAVATQVSDPFDGTLTGEITSENQNISAMQDRSTNMQRLLDQQQQTLQNSFDYMETMMSQIQSQGSYIASYISALNGSSSSSSSSKSS